MIKSRREGHCIFSTDNIFLQLNFSGLNLLNPIRFSCRLLQIHVIRNGHPREQRVEAVGGWIAKVAVRVVARQAVIAQPAEE